MPGEGYRFDGLGFKPPEIVKLDAASASELEIASPPRLSIVVLPFGNIDGGPEQERFADGVTESLTTDLSRIRSAFVICRSIAFTYKGRAGDVRQIGRRAQRALCARRQRAARLDKAPHPCQCAASSRRKQERISGPSGSTSRSPTFSICRTRSSQNFANQLEAELVDAEARRAELAANPDATDLCLQVRSLIQRGLTPDILARARATL